MDMEKCVDEVRRGIRTYREYEYSDRFLDAMTECAPPSHTPSMACCPR